MANVTIFNISVALNDNFYKVKTSVIPKISENQTIPYKIS